MRFIIKKSDALSKIDKKEDIKIEVDFDIADTFYRKLKGLMFKKTIDRPLIFYKCKQVHTFFMKIPIDVYFFDENMKIIDCQEAIKPNKIGRYIKSAYGVIESSANSKLLEIGDEIVKI